MWYVGVDPGKNGGISRVSSDRKHVVCTPFWMCSRAEIPRNHNLIILEKVHAFPGQGVKSMFSFGENYGYWQGLLDACDARYDLVDPKRWIPAMGIEKPKSTPRDEWNKIKKELLLRLAKRLYPDLPYWKENLSFQRAICDSLLIAEYARRIDNGQNTLESLPKAYKQLEKLRIVRSLQRT